MGADAQSVQALRLTATKAPPYGVSEGRDRRGHALRIAAHNFIVDFIIGELGRRAGVEAHTIRHYECIRLIGVPPCGEGGLRLYDRAGVDRLNFVRHARSRISASGYPRAVGDGRQSRAWWYAVDSIARRHQEMWSAESAV